MEAYDKRREVHCIVGASKRESGIVGVRMRKRSLRIPLDLRGIGSTDRTGPVSLKPLVYTLGVELVITGQDP